MSITFATDEREREKGQSRFKTLFVLYQMLPEGGAKDTVSKTYLQVFEASSPCFNTRLGREKRNVVREAIFIMEQRSLTGKHNYGQTVATA